MKYNVPTNLESYAEVFYTFDDADGVVTGNGHQFFEPGTEFKKEVEGILNMYENCKILSISLIYDEKEFISRQIEWAYARLMSRKQLLDTLPLLCAMQNTPEEKDALKDAYFQTVMDLAAELFNLAFRYDIAGGRVEEHILDEMIELLQAGLLDTSKLDKENFLNALKTRGEISDSIASTIRELLEK